MKTKIRDPKEMDCKTCGRVNTEKTCVIFGPPDEDCQFSMNQGRGMICLGCYQAAQVAARKVA